MKVVECTLYSRRSYLLLCVDISGNFMPGHLQCTCKFSLKMSWNFAWHMHMRAHFWRDVFLVFQKRLTSCGISRKFDRGNILELRSTLRSFLICYSLTYNKWLLRPGFWIIGMAVIGDITSILIHLLSPLRIDQNSLRRNVINTIVIRRLIQPKATVFI